MPVRQISVQTANFHLNHKFHLKSHEEKGITTLVKILKRFHAAPSGMLVFAYDVNADTFLLN